MATYVDETGEECRDVATEVDEIEGDIVMWPPKLMRLEGCRNVATDVVDIEGMSRCGHVS